MPNKKSTPVSEEERWLKEKLKLEEENGDIVPGGARGGPKKKSAKKITVPDGPRLYREMAIVASRISGDWYVCSECPQKAGDEIEMCSCLEILMFDREKPEGEET